MRNAPLRFALVRSALEVRVPEERPAEERPSEVRLAEVRIAKVRPDQECTDEVRTAKIRLAKVHLYVKILPSPLVPCGCSLADDLEVFFVWHRIQKGFANVGFNWKENLIVARSFRSAHPVTISFR